MALPNLIVSDPTPSAPVAAKRRAFRPPVGMPVVRQRSRMETAISILLHVAIVWFVLRAPSYVGEVIPIEQGAGGPGPAGGGGGSRMESVQYIQLQPAPPPQPKPTLVFKAPEIKPVPPPEVEPPKLEPISAPISSVSTSTSADPNGGSGPGTGGGVGTGVGTGKGSAIGPGTGGGDQANFAPTTDQMFLPPFPVPPALRGRKIIAEFDIDERGKIVGLVVAGTGDRAYDKRLAEVLRSYRFRPGHRPDGTPIRMKYQLGLEL